MSVAVLGVDGAPGGWLIAEYQLETDALTLHFAESLTAAVSRLHTDVAVLAVDMPIGLSTTGRRPVDALARARLGPRRSTFFPTPIRSVLDYENYAEANAHSKALTDVGLSIQAWNLIPKIREVDELWEPDLRDRLVEAHPETCFAEMAGAPVMTKKATAEGRHERIDLLSTMFDNPIDAVIEQIPRKWIIDAVDAIGLVWTARRVASGDAIVIGGELDAADRPMQLVI